MCVVCAIASTSVQCTERESTTIYMMRSVKAPDAQILALWMEDIARHVDVVMVCCAVCLYICLAYGVCVCV